MLRLNSLVAFIPARNADRAREFYVKVAGLRFVQDWSWPSSRQSTALSFPGFAAIQ